MISLAINLIVFISSQLRSLILRSSIRPLKTVYNDQGCQPPTALNIENW